MILIPLPHGFASIKTRKNGAFTTLRCDFPYFLIEIGFGEKTMNTDIVTIKEIDPGSA